VIDTNAPAAAPEQEEPAVVETAAADAPAEDTTPAEAPAADGDEGKEG
jgi:hypothetical protein